MEAIKVLLITGLMLILSLLIYTQRSGILYPELEPLAEIRCHLCNIVRSKDEILNESIILGSVSSSRVVNIVCIHCIEKMEELMKSNKK